MKRIYMCQVTNIQYIVVQRRLMFTLSVIRNLDAKQVKGIVADRRRKRGILMKVIERPVFLQTWEELRSKTMQSVSLIKRCPTETTETLSEEDTER